jgi:hypothetical protein
VGLPDAMSVLSRWALGDVRSNRGDVGLIRLSEGFVESAAAIWLEHELLERQLLQPELTSSNNTRCTLKHPLHFPLEHKHTHPTIGRENLLKSRLFLPYMPSAPLVRFFSSADTEILLAARTFRNDLEGSRNTIW